MCRTVDVCRTVALEELRKAKVFPMKKRRPFSFTGNGMVRINGGRKGAAWRGI